MVGLYHIQHYVKRVLWEVNKYARIVSTDPNGFTTFYQYDSIGRLKLIRDKDGNVLIAYKYHYQE